MRDEMRGATAVVQDCPPVLRGIHQLVTVGMHGSTSAMIERPVPKGVLQIDHRVEHECSFRAWQDTWELFILRCLA